MGLWDGAGATTFLADVVTVQNKGSWVLNHSLASSLCLVSEYAFWLPNNIFLFPNNVWFPNHRFGFGIKLQPSEFLYNILLASAVLQTDPLQCGHAKRNNMDI